ncbi:putative exonuclease GOR [Cloeon dipterum]|uniref:putative exonuclease GOR n=1 Tax=Cloeon dipterum TaxID=197152 RepID=UPI00321F7C32
MTKAKLDSYAYHNPMRIYNSNLRPLINMKKLRQCERCQRTYTVHRNAGSPGEIDRGDSCFYHPGKIVIPTFFFCDAYYTCCGAKVQPYCATGCVVQPLHGFVSTKESVGSNPVAIAIDCEMCITSNGSECTRVTVVNQFNVVVYESLVWPEEPIIDYVTKYSGITEEILLRGPTRTLTQVQDHLLSFIKSDTILIGHSLESDLRALKLHHNMLVDTSLVFPHKIPGKRRSLRELAFTYLNRTIQNREDGHDSAEDSKACIQLMQYAVGNDRRNSG